MRNMDPGRYTLQQGWDNSALEGYGAVSEPDFRVGGTYRGRRLADEGFAGDPFYPRRGMLHELVDRDIYPHHAPIGGWPPSRRSFDDEYEHIRESRRHDKPLPPSFHETDSYRESDKYRDNYRNADGYYNMDSYHDYAVERPSRFGVREIDALNDDEYEYRHRTSRHSRENSRETDRDYGHYSYDSDHDKGRKEGSWRRRESRDRDRDKRGPSRESNTSPRGRWGRSRSHSRGRDDRSRSRSPRDRSRGRSHREDSYDDSLYDRNDRRRDHEDKRLTDSVEPSATLVVKGLSQKTTEEDLNQILAEWGPLRHVRVIRERHSGSSRGFAFIDFPSTGAACRLMDSVGDDGLVFDGRKLFFEYSSKPTNGVGPVGLENSVKSGHFRSNIQSDWMCTMCGCVNFARRTSCFQCNEGRTDDAPLADVASSTAVPFGKRGSDAGPTHVLVVRGLDENADEEMLRYEFSKHAPVRDIRLVRDKFTHVSRGFAFVHFNSVDDATRALEATNGSKVEKNGQVLRVAFAKSIHGPNASGNPQSSSLAAAAIEAAAFSQQYDAVGWAPKEYNADDKQTTSAANLNGDSGAQKTTSNPQSGFVWDEASGYYYDASSGFYYDGNTGLYYDGNTGTWYSYDQQSQQYVPCSDQNNKTMEKTGNQTSKTSDENTQKKVVISAPATVSSKEKSSLPDAIQAAAAAALAAEKKEKEKSKETKLALKSSLLANKKKMNNQLTMWKQRNHEGQSARIVLDDGMSSGSADHKPSVSTISSISVSGKNKNKPDAIATKESTIIGSGFSSAATIRGTIHSSSLSTQPNVRNQNSPRPVSTSLGGSISGVIRSSTIGVVKSDTIYSGSASDSSYVVASSSASSAGTISAVNSGVAPVSTPFKTDLSALGSYSPSVPQTSGKRRFSETPVQGSGIREQPQPAYRDRAAERRSLYGSSLAAGNDQSVHEVMDSTRDFSYRRGSLESGSMPFPPGVGGGHVSDDAPSYEVVTSDKAIDENNVGNRMLRNMGWQEGSGLGKDGSGITEPVVAQGMEQRAGLGRHQRKAVDPELEAHASDTYRTLIQKKAIARFREMA